MRFLERVECRRIAMSEVTDAIILAGGLGTRMLPASLYMPKETMPLVDTPILNHLIWEATKAGVERIHIVLSERKFKILGDFFDEGGMGVHADIRSDLPQISLTPRVEGVEIITHIQPSAGGVADAMSVALGSIDGPFIVILGDNLLVEEHVSPLHSGPEGASGASLSLVKRFEENGSPCVAVFRVPRAEVSKYGCVKFDGDQVSEIAEKPEANEAPSEFVLCGRYLFPSNTAKILELFPRDSFGEMQSISLMGYLIENGGLEAVKLQGYQFYDSGDPLSWLKSQIDHSLRREDLAKDLREWIGRRIRE